MAGYVLDNKVAVKLNCDIVGVAIPPAPESGYFFPLLPTIETSVRKHLRSKGFDFRVDVSFVGAENPLSTILAAQGNYEFRGPPPKVIEGEGEEAIREWLESKGNLTASFHATFLPCPKAFPGGSTDGRSPLSRQSPVMLHWPITTTLNPSVLRFYFHTKSTSVALVSTCQRL